MRENKMLVPGITQGVQQDCEGNSYRIRNWADGRQTKELVNPPDLTEATKYQLEQVLVESRSRPGTTYTSSRCYQGRGL